MPQNKIWRVETSQRPALSVHVRLKQFVQMINNTDLKQRLHLQVLIPTMIKINKAIFRGQIVISAPLINFHVSNA